VIFSGDKLGARIDVAGLWKDWVASGVVLESFKVMKHGHFLPEEAGDQIIDALVKWMEKYS